MKKNSDMIETLIMTGAGLYFMMFSYVWYEANMEMEKLLYDRFLYPPEIHSWLLPLIMFCIGVVILLLPRMRK